jgi:hypothetical protein
MLSQPRVVADSALAGTGEAVENFEQEREFGLHAWADRDRHEEHLPGPGSVLESKSSNLGILGGVAE